MKKTGMKMLLWSAAAILLAGCQNSVNQVGNAETQAAPTEVADKRFVTDGFLKNRLSLRSIRTATTAGGIMTVEVAATNVRTGIFAQAWSGITGENPYPVDYKFIWQDDRGMTVETPLSVWRTVRIVPGETVYFKGVAPDRRCRDFILSIKESN